MKSILSSALEHEPLELGSERFSSLSHPPSQPKLWTERERGLKQFIEYFHSAQDQVSSSAFTFIESHGKGKNDSEVELGFEHHMVSH